MDDVLLIGGDLCDFALLCEGVEGEGEVVFDVFEEIVVITEVLAREKVADLV